MDFKIPAKDKKEETPKISFTDEDIKGWIDKGATINSDICALVVGPPKIGKTGFVMDCRTEKEKEDGMTIFYIECNLDHGGRINKKIFHSDDPSIIVLSPMEISVDLETGDWKIDPIKSHAKMKALLRYLKEKKDELKIKAIVIDGADIFMSDVCENMMRMSEHLDISGGVQLRFWRKRNTYFYEVINMMFDIDVDKYIISHPKKDNEDGTVNYGVQKDLPSKVHQILEFRQEKDKCIMKVVADRRNKPDILNKDLVIMENIDGKRIWKSVRL